MNSTMCSPRTSAASTAEIIILHPRSPKTTRAVSAVEDLLNLTGAERCVVRDAIIGLPVRWFDASEGAADTIGKPGWEYAYVKQIAGPFIANFKIMRSSAGFMVCLDDGNTLTEEWNGFLTIADAVAVIGYYVEWILIEWGLQVA